MRILLKWKFLIVISIAAIRCSTLFAQTPVQTPIPAPAPVQTYFQQEVNFKIDVKLDDVKSELQANETIEYTNNSTTELGFIYFHLWPNAYKNTNTDLAKQLLGNGNTLFYFSNDEDKGYIDQLDFKVNGHSVLLLADSGTLDICRIVLNEPLKPGRKIIITTPFHVKIPNGMFSRMGHEKQQYQLTQWFPKPAVFDKKGWHAFPYLDQGEFYSEFGSFDVSITVPKNYVVGATGDLQDEEEKEWIHERALKTSAIEHYPQTDSFPQSETQFKTLHFKQSKIHDFAWFCDKRYNILQGEIELPYTHRKVTTWVLFTNGQSRLWKNAIPYVNDALYYYSLWNGEYPYDNCTAVDGALSAGGGMEYPNITVIGATATAFLLDDVIAHEVGHNWFYGILGSNERRHGWMDEGINTFYENRYLTKKYPDQSFIGANPKHDFFGVKKYPHHYQNYLTYVFTAAVNEDQPCDYPADKYAVINYAADVYSKTSIVFDYLIAYLGEETMDKVMQTYFETWKYKHPQPEDLRKVAEDVSGKKLDWFFDDLLETTKKLDYKIVSAKKLKDGSYDIMLKNKGQIKGPVVVSGISGNNGSAPVWSEGFEGEKTVHFPAGAYDKFKIDFSESMPEINRKNNTIRTQGLFKKIEPLHLQALIGFDNPDKTALFYSPVIGWNAYNQFMPGVVLHNMTIPEKRFEFIAMPMYGSGDGDIAGYGNAFFNFHPDGVFSKISIGACLARFAYASGPGFQEDYNKVAPQIEFTFRNKELRSSIRQKLKLRSITILENKVNPDLISSIPIYFITGRNYPINQIYFTRENFRKINPFHIALDIQQSIDFIKTSVEMKYEVTFKEKNKSLDFRFFAGSFLYIPNTNAGSYLNISNPNEGLYSFKLSGWSGYNDYLFDNVFLGRTETSGVFSQQFVEQDGGFKVLTYFGQTTQWITAINIKSSLPGLLPIRLYADIGMTAPDGYANNSQALLYEGGIDLCIVKNVFEIYFPLLLCQDFKTNLKTYNVSYSEQIRFTLNLNLWNPFNFIKNFKTSD